MRIAFIVSEFPSISETFILNQIVGAIERGHEVDIYASRSGDTSKTHQLVEKYQLLDRTYYGIMPSKRWMRVLKGFKLLPNNFYKHSLVLVRSLNIFKYNYSKYSEQAAFFRLFYSAIPLLGKPPYDIIHCHFGPYGIRGVLLRDIGAIQGKLITTFHGFDVNLYIRQHKKDIYKRLFEKGDFYTANTTFTANTAIKLGCPKDRIVILPMGLDLNAYSFHPKSLAAGESIKIITVGRLVEKKGIEYSIRAVGKVLEKYPNIEYRIVGDGYLRQSLENLIAELNLSDRVKLLGWKTQDELRQLYADSHIFILSSVTTADGDQEGQGLVLQEAQAMGLPVLSTLHNGIPDGVLDGESGFLVPERDENALAEKLSYLIENPSVWSDMGRAGRAHVEKNYDINKLNDRLIEIYQQVVN